MALQFNSDKKKKQNLVQNQSVDLFKPQTPFTDLINKDKGQSIAPPKEEEQVNQTPEVFRDPQTGKITAVLNDGKFLPFGDDQEARDYLARREQIKATPQGAIEVGQARANEAELQRKLTTAKQVGKIDFATASQLEEQGVDVYQAIQAGIQSAAPTALSYGATAGAAGLLGGPAAPVTAPAAAGIGAAVGAIKGFYSGVTSNIKAQRNDLASVKTKELKKRTTAINNYISAANTNPANAEEYVAAMNTELSLIRKDYNTLSKRGNEDLRFWGDDATPQLVEYEIFFESTQPSLELKMIQAVSKPDPTRAYIDLETEE